MIPLYIDIDVKIPREDDCTHSNLTMSIKHDILEHCPKGCDGEVLIDIELICKDCGKYIHEVHSGHEYCKYGR